MEKKLNKNEKKIIEKGILEKDLSKEVKALIERLSAIKDFNTEAIEKEFRTAIGDLGLKMKDLVHPTRIALTGKRIGPGLFETMEVLGKDRICQRLGKLIDYWTTRPFGDTQG